MLWIGKCFHKVVKIPVYSVYRVYNISMLFAVFVLCSLFPKVLMSWILRNGCVQLEQKWQLRYHCTPTFLRRR